MRIRIVVTALCALVTSLSLLAITATAAPPRAAAPLSVPVIATQTGGVLDGVFTITSLAVNDAGQLVASGTFTGTALVDGILQTVSTAATSAVAATGTCPILDLTLGPLHLDLLGLVVDLNQVHLQITAQSGPGNLLGNLLCAVTHLLDGPGAGVSAAIQRFLDSINAILGAL